MPPAKRKRVLEDTDSEDDAPLAQPLAAATPMVDGAEAVAETPGSTRPRRRRRLMKQTDDDEGFAEVFDAPASVPALAARPQAAQAGAQPSLAQRLQERRDQKKRDTLAAKSMQTPLCLLWVCSIESSHAPVLHTAASALPDDAADAACASGASQDEAALATGNTARKLALLEKAILVWTEFSFSVSSSLILVMIHLLYALSVRFETIVSLLATSVETNPHFST